MNETLANIFTIAGLGAVLVNLSIFLTICLTLTGILLNVISIREKLNKRKGGK